ncbi:MAG: DUF423 domain-containing protein [Gammaproteobacteria bacterium]
MFGKKSHAVQFENLLRPHLEHLYRVAYRFAGNVCDAEDLVQDLLVKLYPKLSELTAVEQLRPWLARALYYHAIDKRRRGIAILKLLSCGLHRRRRSALDSEQDCMPQTARLFLLLGALNAGLAVLLGAFGAHALKNRLAPDLLAVYHTGNQYHFYHAFGLLLVGLIALHVPASLPLRSAGWLLLLGIVLFSGSLYALALSGVRGLGAITPLGGAAFIVAWLLLAFAVWKS